MMTTITLRNDFHNTEVKVRGPWENAQDAWFAIQAAVHGETDPTEAAKRRLRRVRKALCGMKDCGCGTVR